MDFTATELKALFAAFAVRMAAERDYLCQLDGAIGDGDHGIAMEQGMAAAALATQAAQGNLQDICNAAAKGFLNAVGASSGPLYATAFMFAGKALGQVDAVSRKEMLHMIPAIGAGIVHRGKAKPGQKTMLDAWHPAGEAVLAGAGADDVAEAAWNGARSTADMVARMGRAERLQERSLGHPDPGAVSAAMLIHEIAKLSKQNA